MSKHSSTSWHLSTDQSEELLDKLKSQLPNFTELTSLLQPLASWGGGGGVERTSILNGSGARRKFFKKD